MNAPGVVATNARRELEELEIELLLTALARRYGYDFRQYAPAPRRRCIRRAVAKRGVSNITELQAELLHRPESLRDFVSELAVPVTKMFRDPDFYRALRERVVPILRTYPSLRIWHAGCSSGEEVYSLAILLAEEGLYDRCRIYATDISDALLERAARRSYPLSALNAYEDQYRKAGGTRDFNAYFRIDGRRAQVHEELAKHVVLSQHNLAVDGSFNEFQLILCRNVLIYFNPVLQRRTHQLLYDSLGRFGVLGLGMREGVTRTPVEDRYETLDAHLRLYRRTR